MPRDLPSDMNRILADENANVSFSTAGSGGSILARNGEIGLAIKIEGETTTMDAGRLGTMMTGFFENAQGEQPFEAPETQVFRPDDNLDVEALHDMAYGGITVPEGREENATNARNALDSFAHDRALRNEEGEVLGKPMVTLQEFAKGTQLNKLDDATKLDLYRDPEFARQLGKSMPVMAAMGLGDHLSATGLNNPSNLMYAPGAEGESGTLSVIDYATSGGVDPQSGRAIIKDPVANIQKMHQQLRAMSGNPDQYDQGVAMIAGNADGIGMAVEALSNGGGDYFFTDNNFAAANLRVQDRQEFTRNMLAGMVDGLDYLQNNEEALVNAARNLHEKGPDGTAIEHFYTEEQLTQIQATLGTICEEIPDIKAGLELNQLEAGLRQMKAQENNIQEQLDQQKNGLLNRVRTKLNPEARQQLKQALAEIKQEIRTEEQKVAILANQKMQDLGQGQQAEAPARNVAAAAGFEEPDPVGQQEVLAQDENISEGVKDAREVCQEGTVAARVEQFEQVAEGPAQNNGNAV